MSIISEYYKSFSECEPAIDFADSIVDLCCWVLHSLDKRDEKKGFSAVEMSEDDIPSRELGFRVMPMVYRKKRPATRKKRPATPKRETMVEFYDVFNGTSQKVPMTETFEYVPIPDGMFPANVPVADVTWSSSNGASLCFAYNLNLGEVYYANGIGVMYANRGTRLYTWRKRPHILAFNWITGKAYEIPIPVEKLMEALPRATWYSCSSGLAEDHLALCQIESKLANKWALCTPVFNWLEQIYDFPTNYLRTIADAYSEYLRIVRGFSYKIPLGNLYYSLAGLLVYFGNLFQSVLQTLSNCSWFLPLLIYTINMGSPMPQKYNSIRNWLGITKPIYKKLFSEKDEKKFVFFMCMRMHEPNVSYEVFERVYKKVELLDKELSENALSDPAFCYGGSKTVAIRGPRGRKLFQTKSLPASMAFYMDHRLHKSISINHYYKWLLDECYIMAKSERYSRDAYICGLVQKTTVDFNRMAQEIMPGASFTLPHNVDAAHDAMLVNFNKIKADAGDNITDTVALAACYRYRPLYSCSTGRYIFSAPLCASDLYEEGIQLNHCVGSYAKDIIAARGSMLIVFMRYRKSPSKSLITVQLNRATGGNYYISEAAGAGNRPLNKSEKEHLQSWLVSFNGIVSDTYGKKREDISVMPYLDGWLKWATGQKMSKSVISDVITLDPEKAALHVAQAYFAELKDRADKYSDQGGVLNVDDYINIRLAALYGYCVNSPCLRVEDFISIAKKGTI